MEAFAISHGLVQFMSKPTVFPEQLKVYFYNLHIFLTTDPQTYTVDVSSSLSSFDHPMFGFKYPPAWKKLKYHLQQLYSTGKSANWESDYPLGPTCFSKKNISDECKAKECNVACKCKIEGHKNLRLQPTNLALEHMRDKIRRVPMAIVNLEHLPNTSILSRLLNYMKAQ